MTPAVEATLYGFLDAQLSAPAGQTIAVVGPNGAGKSTLLRALAGLPAPAQARLHLDGRDVTARPPHRRSVGYVPQQGALFPHLTALGNVAYGPRARGQRRRIAEQEAQAWLHRLQAAHLAGRKPAEMSGGQAQRVALARALATQPRMLLLDEPLAALDAATRTTVRQTLRGHLRSYEGVCLVVTHDPVDAVALASRVLVIEFGRIVQDAPPEAVTRAPRSAWVARMLGRNAYLGMSTRAGVALVSAADDEPAAADSALVTADPLPPGCPVLATVLPEAVALHRKRPDGSPRNAWPGNVAEVTPVGSRVRVSVTGVGGPDIVAEITPQAVADLSLAEGVEVWASVKATEVALTSL